MDNMMSEEQRDFLFDVERCVLEYTNYPYEDARNFAYVTWQIKDWLKRYLNARSWK